MEYPILQSKIISLRYKYFVDNQSKYEGPVEYANLNGHLETYTLPHRKRCKDTLLSLPEGRK